MPNPEDRRLAAVLATQQLGTAAEERFDRITRIACKIFNVPISVIDLVGEHLVWIKSAVGIDIFEGNTQTAYCTFTLLMEGREVCHIPDAREDPRLIDNPYRESCVFYAGVPLYFHGEKVGSLCIVDSVPRDMTHDEFNTLRDLAVFVEHELEIVALSTSQLELTKINNELEVRSVTDVLTRCWNRAGIFEVAETESRKACITDQLGIAIIDIDLFKQINDTYGHPAGDEVLRVVAQRFRAIIRSVDAIGRYGGEEFLAILPNVDSASFGIVCERLRNSICNDPIIYQGQEIFVTCSIGGILGDGSKKIDDLIFVADERLYSAKTNGRNQSVVE